MYQVRVICDNRERGNSKLWKFTLPKVAKKSNFLNITHKFNDIKENFKQKLVKCPLRLPKESLLMGTQNFKKQSLHYPINSKFCLSDRGMSRSFYPLVQ